VLNAFSIVARPKDVGGVVAPRLNRRHKSLQHYAPYALSDEFVKRSWSGLRS